MATPSFQSFGNHFFVAASQWKDNGIYTDKNHLFNLYGDNLSTYHLGVLNAWNQYAIVDTTLKSMLELDKKTLFVNGDDGEVEFSMAYKLPLPTIKEDLTTNDKPGIDGQLFEILVGSGGDRPDFQVHEIIGADRYDGQQLYIHEVRQRLGEGHVYLVELIAKNKKKEWYDKRYLAPGMQYKSFGSRINEVSETFKGINNGYGMMKLKHKLGSWRGVEYTISGSAQRLKLAGKGIDFERRYSDVLNPMNDKFILAMGMQDSKGRPIPGTVSWVTYAEAMIAKELYRDEEQSLMFGQAGEITVPGTQRKEYIAEGLYHQMKAGNWLKIPRWSKDILMSLGGKLFQNRPDIAPEDRYFEFQGGFVAVQEFRQIFAQQASDTLKALNVMLDNKSVGVVSGDRMNLSVAALFGKMFIPGVGNFTIKYNPAFDAEGTREEDRPLTRGFGVHSATAAIFDVTDSVETNAAKFGANITTPEGTKLSSNVFMIKNAGMPNTKVSYLNGRTSPYEILKGKGSIVSSRRDEYTTMMENQSSVMLVDPTRSALVELQK